MSLYSIQTLRTPRSYSEGLTRFVDSVWSRLGEGLTYSTSHWTSTSRLAKSSVLKVLSGISVGKLVVVTADGEHTFGNPDEPEESTVTLKVLNDAFWMRLLLSTDLGLAESYMSGEIDGDMSALLKLVIANRSKMDTIGSLAAPLMAVGRKLTAYKFLGDLSTSAANISAHYDLGNTLFTAMLSEDMNYSSAIFLDYLEDLTKPAKLCEPLEDAQMRKMKNIIRRARVRPGDRVLEIGTGWGALSITLAKTVDCTIDTVTLSLEQRDLAVARIAKAGLSDRITVHYMDFRQCMDKPEWAGAFDRFISIEMIENVGREFIEEYWKVVDWALNPKSAIGVVQVISMPEARIPAYDAAGVDFIQKWVCVFPGCYIPSLTFLVDTLSSGSGGGRLTIDSVENIGPHYARTLREWKRKFLANWESVIAAALIKQYDLDAAGLAIFKRKWIYYFDYCEAGFATRTLGDHIITFTREGDLAFGCDVVPVP